jgi:hypothetical protein
MKNSNDSPDDEVSKNWHKTLEINLVLSLFWFLLCRNFRVYLLCHLEQ